MGALCDAAFFQQRQGLGYSMPGFSETKSQFPHVYFRLCRFDTLDASCFQIRGLHVQGAQAPVLARWRRFPICSKGGQQLNALLTQAYDPYHP